MNFESLDPETLDLNAWKAIGSDWMLLTAGGMGAWNTMTASWGGFGVLWNRDVVFAFVRPTRHTFGFMERSSAFTCSFFDPDRKAALSYCGSVSGRDEDKAAGAGITPFECAPGLVAFEEARLVLGCRVVHAQDLDPAGFKDPAIHDHYTDDWHRLYVGEITVALERKG